ncbi:MAG TPA: Rv3235 family protein [Actinomycetota bacterium]|nr:Rv3235 family protein [Actinomycetota bacterium]
MNNSAAAVSVIESWTPPVHQPRPRHLHLVRPTPPIGPDAAWVRRLTQSVVEVLGGQRSATTLVRVLSPAVFQSLREPDPRPQLREGKVLSIRTQPLGQDSIEVAAVIGCPQRTRALALRLQQRHQRWRCVCIVVL